MSSGPASPSPKNCPQPLFQYGDRRDGEPDALWGNLLLFKISVTAKKFSGQ